MSKKESILNRPDDPAAEVAADLDTSVNYVHKVRSQNRTQGHTAAEREMPTDTPPVEQNAPQEPQEPQEPPESDPVDDPLADLLIEDTHDEYECGDCEATVEYLQESCDNCGKDLMWFK